MVDNNTDYCPSCSLRQRDGQTRWWRIYTKVPTEDDPIREHYEDDLPPSNLSQVPPDYYEHVLDIYSIALLRNSISGLPVEEPDIDLTGAANNPSMDETDAEWLRENYPEIENRHRDKYPASAEARSE